MAVNSLIARIDNKPERKKTYSHIVSKYSTELMANNQRLHNSEQEELAAHYYPVDVHQLKDYGYDEQVNSYHEMVNITLFL